MVTYECFRCGYCTKQKTHFINHLNRKNICNPTDEDVSIEQIKEYYGFGNENKIAPNCSKLLQNDSISLQHDSNYIAPTCSKLLQNCSKIAPNCSKILENNESKATCEYCQRKYTRNSNLTKHLKTCKKKKEAEILVVNQNEEIVKMKKKIKELEDFKIHTQNNITNSNNTNSHNTTNNNTIIINNHGEENIEHLSKKYLLNLFSKTYRAIPLLVEKIHFDPEHPENQNIKLSNKKLPYIKIKKNDKWQFVDRKSEIIDLIDAMCFILLENYQNMNLKGENNLNERQKSVIDKYLEKYRNDDKKLMKELESIVDLTLINNSL